MNYKGFVLIHRNIKNWEWYDHPPTRLIFEHCLYSANYEDENWRGQPIKRGQFPTSIEKLAIANGLTNQQTRTALKNLQSTREINIQTTNKYSIITVLNWDLYQPNQQTKKQTNQQTNNKQTNKQKGGSNNNTTINKEINNNKNNNIYNISSSSSSNVEKLIELSEEEEELLKSFSKRKKGRKIGNYTLWREKVLKNPNLKNILLEEKEKIKAEKERKLQAENIPPEIEEQSSPEDEQRGRELLKNTISKIRKGA